MPSYTVRTTEGKGRVLEVAAEVPAGAAVLACEPFEATLLEEQASTRSHLRFVKHDTLQRCAGCKFAW